MTAPADAMVAYLGHGAVSAPPIETSRSPDTQVANGSPECVDANLLLASACDQPPSHELLESRSQVAQNTPKPLGGQPVSEKTSWTVQELYDATFQELVWLVSNLLLVGLFIIAGRPKVGKSWFMLQMAAAIATGTPFLGFEVVIASVLYLALEDSERRLQQRLQKQRVPPDARIRFVTRFPPLSREGLDQLEEWLATRRYKLVVIDTLSRAFGRADQNDLGEMTEVMGRLQQLAFKYDVAIVLIDHHRKPGVLGGDPVDDVIGSTGKSAVVDGIFGLHRTRGKRGTTLKVVGRDFDEREIVLDWQSETCTWQLLDGAGPFSPDSLKGKILAGIEGLVRSGSLPTTEHIAELVRSDRGNVNHAIQDMVSEGILHKGPKRKREQPYYIVGQHDDLTSPSGNDPTT